MRADGGLYPSLGRFFGSLVELADAGCMSKQRARDCLDGKKAFTNAEKKAISANIVAKLLEKKDEGFEYSDFWNAQEAWQGKFDEIYKRKVG